MNEVVLDGLVVERRALRYTPAGIPALDLVIAHESTQGEQAQGQRISLQLKAVAFGPVAQLLSEAGLNSGWRFQGHLTARPVRPGVVNQSVRLQVQVATPIQPA